MFSVEEYKHALIMSKKKMHKKHYEMLEVQYWSPNRTITAGHLAKSVGYTNFSSANLHYGKLGRLLSDSLEILPKKRKDGTYSWWRILSSGKYNSDKSNFLWTMHPELAKALEELGIVTYQEIKLPDEITEIGNLREGAARQVLVNAYERNPEARSRCIAHYGVRCVVCNFDFAAIYGEIGEGYIHVHHLQQISLIGEEYEVHPIADLRPVCPNCHAMIHRRIPPYEIEDVQLMISKMK